MAAAAASEVGGEDPSALVTQLEELLESGWGPERSERLRRLKKTVIGAAPPAEDGSDAKQRAAALALRGRALAAAADDADESPFVGAARDDATREAAACLSKAVKMDSSLVLAWCALGRLAWVQGRMKDALEAYSGALSADPTCVPALRDSARVLRRQGGRENVELACERSKTAVGRSVQDGLSWYVHGMVMLSKYFSLGFDVADLRSALKAFSVANRTGQEGNPDLHMNRAQAERYLVMWAECAESLRRATELDPDYSEARASIEGLKQSMEKLHTKWTTECGYQERPMSKLLKQLPGGATRMVRGRSLQVVPFRDLPAGESGCLSESCCVVMRVLELVDEAAVPLLYIATDASRTLCCVAVYGIDRKAISSGTEIVYAAAPFYRRRVPGVVDGALSSDPEKGWEALVFVADRAAAVLVGGKLVDRSMWSRLSLVVERKGQ
eukprot:TRINITY_DN40369_c0_g1_i1.p1 TRINITY_DN40369_c0_g1~~TRINITY_DN40369_c0_g1_i1.p1  ORF type:complete len:442 (+),score=97.60 TRINITY_DN40369_c0_g1_i1:87-1412(+)